MASVEAKPRKRITVKPRKLNPRFKDQQNFRVPDSVAASYFEQAPDSEDAFKARKVLRRTLS